MRQPHKHKGCTKGSYPRQGMAAFPFVERAPHLSRNFFEKVCLFCPFFRSKGKEKNNVPVPQEATA